MNAGVTSERIYDAIKARLLSGEILPGTRLEPAAFAELVGSSVTPVRDALHRLAGEHIVEMRPAEGFQLPFVTEPGLRDLLAWNADLLRLALRRRQNAEPPPPDFAFDDYVGGIRALFATIAGRSGNIELARHIESASDRLTPARHAESRLLPDPAGELAALAAVLSEGDAHTVGGRIAAYHRQCAKHVPAIVRALYGIH
ncbi:GntR family transcriptional regulator [Sphingomonas koreensis]|uniref:GntR family transcriptional regulator n=1 Tax=Sphingomonas koreensis TaxID=93064 RepID=UPI0008331917|nr:GntR family transcriptional regulator [Sphingomonas koreensis]PJI87185.1 regulatory GntR family protein [Sphingomonas koreensis]RSU59598.1 GntR family transcriptional regulator [Sphingomonas koreensis]RSU68752.1 GntR family transcriptional regulator [Sphingomonas koreensis]